MKIQFVLVEPKVPENIGASARAIRTMGFDTLILVKPCNWKEGKSKWVAHGSSDILENARIFETLDEAIKNSDFSVATSAKRRTVKQDYIQISELAGFLRSKNRAAEIVSVVFGREESGLTNSEMKLCDITSTIPMACQYPSLNLSQAVMLYAYELSGLSEESTIAINNTIESFSFRELKSKTRNLLSMIGINENDNRYGRIMERIAFLSNDDINLMHSVTAIISECLKNNENMKS